VSETNLWDNRLDRMRPGERGWVHPDAVSVDLSGQRWLSGGYALYSRKTKTATVRVEYKDDGFHVTPPKGQHWEPTQYVPGPEGAFRVVMPGAKAAPEPPPEAPRRRGPGGPGPGGPGGGDDGGEPPRMPPPPPDAPALRATVTEVERALPPPAESVPTLPKPQRVPARSR
jgi:hypothetical protein